MLDFCAEKNIVSDIERLANRIWILKEMARDLSVFRIESKRKIGRKHRRLMLLVRVKGVRNDLRRILRDPLLRPGRALCQFIFIAK